MQDTPIPSTAPPRDFNDADLNRLFDLLDAAPESFGALDPSVVDGLICGVLVQPVLIPAPEWLALVFEGAGDPLPAETASWRTEVEALLVRRQAALNRAIVEDGWFDPLVFGFDADNPPAVSEYEPLASLPPVSQAIAPWVEGFLLALDAFPALREQSDDDLDKTLAPLLRHRVPAEPPATRPSWNADDPMAGFDVALDALVNAVVELADRTMGVRYKVDTVRRAEPKVGRNDPCPCGSGKKYKRCHGAD